MTALHDSPIVRAFESSSQLRVFKTKLTRAASVLSHLSDSQAGLGRLLNPNEQAVLEQSLQVIQTFSQRVDEARECKIQDEKDLEQAFNARQIKSWELTKVYFPLVHETLDQQVHGFNVARCLNRLGLYQGGKNPSTFEADLLQLAEGLSQNFGVEYFYHELFSNCQQRIQEFISAPSSEAVECQLQHLKLLIADLLPSLSDNTLAHIEKLNSQQSPLFARGGPADGSSARN